MQVIKDYQLMAVVCILVLVDVLVLTVWEFADPLVIVVSNKTLEQIVSISSNSIKTFIIAQSWIPSKKFTFMVSCSFFASSFHRALITSLIPNNGGTVLFSLYLG